MISVRCEQGTQQAQQIRRIAANLHLDVQVEDEDPDNLWLALTGAENDEQERRVYDAVAAVTSASTLI